MRVMGWSLLSRNMKQLSLPISWSFSKNVRDFVVSDCNRYAFEWLEKWPLKIRSNFVCLVGEKGSGKTHLTRIWADRLGAEYLNPENVLSKWFMMTDPETHQKYFVLDDADELEDDMLLFCIYNTIKEQDAYLLLTARQCPNRWNLKYNDIKSRLSTVDILKIQKPGEIAINSIIEKMLLQRGLKSTPDIVEYLANRIERSYESICYWVDRIDSQQLNKGNKLSLQTVREALR